MKIDNNKTISVVIPVYNENIIIIETIKECILCLTDINSEIIIVDDGSLDGTYEKVQEFVNGHKNVKVVTYGDNHGKGFAVRYGALLAQGDLIAFIDADMNIHPRYILTLIDKMKNTDADIVVASKRHPDSIVDYPINRKIFSDIYYLFVKILFGIPTKDTQAGLKLYKRKVIEDIFPIVLVKRYAFDIEILANAHRLGYIIEEVPIKINIGFDSHIDKNAIWNMFVDTCAVFYRMKIKHYYDEKKNGVRKKL